MDLRMLGGFIFALLAVWIVVRDRRRPRDVLPPPDRAVKRNGPEAVT